MKRKMAKWGGRLLYCLLMICIPLIIYFEIQGRLLAGILLVVLMFVIAMSRLWLSEYEDESLDAQNSNSSRMRSTDKG
ncbi:hypothetical protein [Paenibacillus sp. UNC451MF]|uniref:hypothetical protein n=1 Tax=Paenibacillus sp. UNC451MF TaxID=1449063 RepID=UPI00048F0A1C|nr:hypothetical protein [Paenibacillus sp. UNC451MF]